MQIKNLKNKLFRGNMSFIFSTKSWFDMYIHIQIHKICVALPEATPSRFFTSSLHPPSLRSGSARRPNALRAAQQIIIVLLFPKRLPRNNPRHHDKRDDIWDGDG